MVASRRMSSLESNVRAAASRAIAGCLALGSLHCTPPPQLDRSDESSELALPGVEAQTSTTATPSSMQVTPADDPQALGEVLGKLPAPLPRTSASGTLVGTPTLAEEGAPEPNVLSETSMISMQPNLKTSNAGGERDLRATLYFDLVNQCRDEDGEILPANAIEIDFRVDSGGLIDRSSVRARALEPQYEAAAQCMVRVIRTGSVNFGSTRLDEPMRVKALVPSVD